MENSAQVIRPYTLREELWSSLIHGAGIALSIAGLVILVTFASLNGDAWAIVSTADFRRLHDCALHGLYPLSCRQKSGC